MVKNEDLKPPFIRKATGWLINTSREIAILGIHARVNFGATDARCESWVQFTNAYVKGPRLLQGAFYELPSPQDSSRPDASLPTWRLNSFLSSPTKQQECTRGRDIREFWLLQKGLAAAVSPWQSMI